MSRSYKGHTTHNTTVPADELASFRADVKRMGGHVFRSAPIGRAQLGGGRTGAGYAVSYVMPADADEVAR